MSVANHLERYMLKLINEERADAGLDRVSLEVDLNRASEMHSEWIIDTETFSHNGAGGSHGKERMEDAGFRFSGRWVWGENLALQAESGRSGIKDDVADLHESLMNSSGHRANILNPDVEVVGIGIETGEYRGFDVVAVTQDFAKTSASMRIDGGAEPKNAAPSVNVADVTLEAGEIRGLEDMVSYADKDGDDAVRFEVKDTSGDATFRLGDSSLDARRGVEVDADRLHDLQIEGVDPGTDETLRIRANDGEEWSAWDKFEVTTEDERQPEKPEEGRHERHDPDPEPAEKPDHSPDKVADAHSPALDLGVDDIELMPYRFSKFGREISLKDADDASVIEVRDDDGQDNFWLMSRGRLDADDGATFSVDQLDQLWLQGERSASTQTLELRAGDGDTFGDWQEFSLTTSDWHA